MDKITPDTPAATSADLVEENIERLRQIFPDAFTEDGVDFEVLRQLLGDEVDDTDERYGLSWHGKRRAREMALTPSLGTLRPAPEDSVDWDTTENLMIEGDNLEVLKLLQKPLAGKVKLIYIDPPYNTGKDFVYKDDFKDNIQNYLEVTGQVDEDGNRTSSEEETAGRFHTDWLNMMYPRLALARNLLRDDGVIFISIDDSEVTRLDQLCDEIFGERNLLARLVWKSKSGGANDSAGFAVDHEYVLAYGRFVDGTTVGLDLEAEVSTSYNKEDSRGRFALERLDKQNLGYQPSLDFEIVDLDGNSYRPKQRDPKKPNARWRWSKDTVRDRYDELVFENGCVYTKNYESKGAKPRSLLFEDRFGRTRTGKTECSDLMDGDVFSNPKPTKLIRHLAGLATSEDSEEVILDFFAGSGTTGHAVMAQNATDGGNRRYILVQLPEPLDPENKDQKTAAEFCQELKKPLNIAELTKERLRRAAAKVKEGNPEFEGDLGFKVFKLDSTNFREWDPDPENLQQTLEDSANHLKDGRSEADVLYELLLKLGVDLNTPIEEREIEGKTVHSIGLGAMFVCLDESVKKSEVDPLAQGILDWRKELGTESETSCIFRDSAFEDDSAKVNLTEILRQADITEVRSV